MLPSKAKSGLSEALNGKTASATPKISKIARNGSTKSDSGSPSPVPKPTSPAPKPSSPVPKSRSSIERSPKSAESKPPIKTGPAPEKLQRKSKGSDLQAKLDVTEDDLKKAREQLASVEQEKMRAVGELKEAKRLTNDANEKLQEAIAAKKMAEETLEIEKFRADELEQANVEAAQRREEDHQNELESIRNQHALGASTLLSATQELQKVKLELANATDERNTALGEADDARKVAEMSGEKVEVLSREVSHLKSLLDSKLDNMNKAAAEMIKKLNVEINALEFELERAKSAEEKLRKIEALVGQLRMEVTDVKKAETDARKQVDELKKVVASLETRLKGATKSEKTAIESLAITMKKMEEGTALLQDAETEIAVLKGKIESMEIEVARCKNDLEESDRNLDLSQQVVASSGKRYEVMLDEARYEIVCLKKTVERFETETNNSSTEWQTKELNFIHSIKKSEYELASLKAEMAEAVDSLKVAEQEAQAAKAEGVEMLSKVREAESAASAACEVAEEAKAETLRLKERLLDKENELQSITQENDEHRIGEASALQKIKELSSLLEEATAKRTEESVKLSKCGGEYDLLPNISQEINAREKAIERSNPEAPSWMHENGYEDDRKTEESEKGSQIDEEEDHIDKMAEDLASEKDHEAESLDDDSESKMDGGSYEEINGMTESMALGSTSPTKNQQQKKKKALLHKFGNLLKKKGSHKSHK